MLLPLSVYFLLDTFPVVAYEGLRRHQYYRVCNPLIFVSEGLKVLDQMISNTQLQVEFLIKFNGLQLLKAD